MKLPKGSVYWDCIANYLDLKCLATFEATLDNHQRRQDLMLHPVAESPRSSVIYEKFSPYESILTMNDSVEIYITSIAMMNWCQKRRIKLINIKLDQISDNMNLNVNMNMNFNYRLNPNPNLNSSPTHDCLSTVKYLSIKTTYPRELNLTFQFINRLKNLQSISLSETWKITHDDVDLLIARNRMNTTSYDSIYVTSNIEGLKSLKLKITSISIRSFKSLIFHSQSIESIDLLDAGKLTNNHLRMMAKCLRRLSTFKISINNEITDEGFNEFPRNGHQFKCLRFNSCAKITHIGLIKLLSDSQLSLESLDILNMKSLTSSSISTLFVQSYTKLENVNIQMHTFSPDSCSDDFLIRVSNVCPSLKRLKLSFQKQMMISESGILAVIKKCPCIEELVLTKAPTSIVERSQELLSHANANRLKKTEMNSL